MAKIKLTRNHKPLPIDNVEFEQVDQPWRKPRLGTLVRFETRCDAYKSMYGHIGVITECDNGVISIEGRIPKGLRTFRVSKSDIFQVPGFCVRYDKNQRLVPLNKIRKILLECVTSIPLT